MNKQYFKNNFLVLCAFVPLCICAFVFLPQRSSAKIEDYNKETSFGKYDPDESFNISITDKINNVEKLIIRPHTPNPTKYPISHEELYTDGINIDFEFKHYNPETNEIFEINIENNTEQNIGNEYIINNEDNNKIRFLPGSFIKLLNPNLYWNNNSSTEKFGLNIFFNGDETRTNMQKDDDGKYNLSKEYGKSWGDFDLDECMEDELCFEQLIETMEFDFKIKIPIKVPHHLSKDIALVNGREVFINESLKNYNKPVLNHVEARIYTENGHIILESGLENIARIDLEEDKEVDTGNNIEEEKKSTKPIGFSTFGFKLPGRDEYKGISNETSIENTILGLTNFVLSFVAVIAVIMLIYGGYLWIMDRGEDEFAEKSKKIIASAVIGILIIISAFTIVNTVVEMQNPYPEACEIDVELPSHGENSVDVECGSPLVNFGISSAINSIIN